LQPDQAHVSKTPLIFRPGTGRWICQLPKAGILLAVPYNVLHTLKLQTHLNATFQGQQKEILFEIQEVETQFCPEKESHRALKYLIQQKVSSSTKNVFIMS